MTFCTFGHKTGLERPVSFDLDRYLSEVIIDNPGRTDAGQASRVSLRCTHQLLQHPGGPRSVQEATVDPTLHGGGLSKLCLSYTAKT